MKFEELVKDFQEEEDIELFIQFVKRYFHNKYILTRQDFLRWQYDKKFCKSPSLSIKVLKIKNKFMGYLGLVPIKFSFFGKEINAKCFANLMIDQSIRKIGLGSILIKKAEEEIDLLYVTAYNDNVAKVYKSLEWNINILLKRFVYILNLKKVSELSLSTFPYEINSNSYVNENLTFHIIDSFDSKINEFWNDIKHKYPITAERNVDYLNWRYSNHPIIKYKIFIVKKGNTVKSFIVLRIEEPPNYKIGRIIDFISDDDAEEFTLYKLIEYCKKERIDFIDFFFTGNFHVDSLKKLGFKETDEEPYISIPMLFNPIDRSRKSINFAFKLIDKSLYDERIEDINNWYITKGDGDQDRPNIHPVERLK